MTKEKKWEVEASLPGLLKGKVSGTSSPVETRYSYSCTVNFDSLEDAKIFRDVVEKAVSEKNGEMYQSHLDTIEKISD